MCPNPSLLTTCCISKKIRTLVNRGIETNRPKTPLLYDFKIYVFPS